MRADSDKASMQIGEDTFTGRGPYKKGVTAVSPQNYSTHPRRLY